MTITDEEHRKEISKAQSLLNELKSRERGKVPLRIDNKTILLVNPDCDMKKKKEDFILNTKRISK